MFRNVTKDGNADHLHMYKQKGIRKVSDRNNVTSAYGINSMKTFFKSRSPPKASSINTYSTGIKSPNMSSTMADLESKHQELAARQENHLRQQQLNKSSNATHSMSGRYRVYDILSRVNITTQNNNDKYEKYSNHDY